MISDLNSDIGIFSGNISWSIRDFFGDYTNPIENTRPWLNLRPIYLFLSPYLQTPFPIFYRLFAAPSVEPWSACYRRSTRFPEYSTSALTMRLSSNAPCTSQWNSIHKPPTIEISCSFDIYVIEPWLCRCVAGKETRCRSTADNRFPRSIATCRQTWFETQGSWKCQKVLITVYHLVSLLDALVFFFFFFPPPLLLSLAISLSSLYHYSPTGESDNARVTSNPWH